MIRLDFVSRVVTAAALVALAVTIGVWLTQAPLTTAPAAPPVKPAEPLPEPKLAPTPSAPRTAIPATIDVLGEAETVAPAAVPEPRAVEPAERKSQPRPACQPRRRGLFGRRR